MPQLWWRRLPAYAFKRVPASYWPILAIALTNVSWTKSSASDGCWCKVRAKARKAGMR